MARGWVCNLLIQSGAILGPKSLITREIIYCLVNIGDGVGL
jgi:hypothetical protein